MIGGNVRFFHRRRELESERSEAADFYWISLGLLWSEVRFGVGRVVAFGPV
jgi:hypothetical protein